MKGAEGGVVRERLMIEGRRKGIKNEEKEEKLMLG